MKAKVAFRNFKDEQVEEWITATAKACQQSQVALHFRSY
jgi:hypothetical protein